MRLQKKMSIVFYDKTSFHINSRIAKHISRIATQKVEKSFGNIKISTSENVFANKSMSFAQIARDLIFLRGLFKWKAAAATKRVNNIELYLCVCSLNEAKMKRQKEKK